VLTLVKRGTGNGNVAIADLVGRGALTEDSLATLEDALVSGANVVVVGDDAGARTTVLNTLASLIPKTDRAVVLEAMPSVQMAISNVVWLRAQPLREERAQLIASLPSLQADRIVADRLSGVDTAGLLELGLGGARGLLMTAFGDSPADAITRLASFCEVSGRASSSGGGHCLVASGIDVLVHAASGPDGCYVATLCSVSMNAAGDAVDLSDL
jgi:pilus assembly protein CpaF